MNNRPCQRAASRVCPHVSHHIVPALLFFLGCKLKVYVTDVLLQLFKLLVCNLYSKLLLRRQHLLYAIQCLLFTYLFRLGEVVPKLSPCGKLLPIGKVVLHFLACVATVQGARIATVRVVCCHCYIAITEKRKIRTITDESRNGSVQKKTPRGIIYNWTPTLLFTFRCIKTYRWLINSWGTVLICCISQILSVQNLCVVRFRLLGKKAWDCCKDPTY